MQILGRLGGGVEGLVAELAAFLLAALLLGLGADPALFLLNSMITSLNPVI
jgi:hypothetical protein